MSSAFIIPSGTKALIFDCDGTLVDSMPLHMQAWEKAFNHFGASYKRDFMRNLNGMEETAIVELYNQTFFTKLNPRKVVDKKHSIFIDYIPQVKTIPAVADFAKQYHKKCPMAVVSGGRREIVHAELQNVGLFDLFDIILTADNPIRPKPEPDLFLEAARRMNIDPQSCLVFEDGDSGIRGAKKAGMQAINIMDHKEFFFC